MHYSVKSGTSNDSVRQRSSSHKRVPSRKFLDLCQHLGDLSFHCETIMHKLEARLALLLLPVLLQGTRDGFVERLGQRIDTRWDGVQVFGLWRLGYQLSHRRTHEVQRTTRLRSDHRTFAAHALHENKPELKNHLVELRLFGTAKAKQRFEKGLASNLLARLFRRVNRCDTCHDHCTSNTPLLRCCSGGTHESAI